MEGDLLLFGFDDLKIFYNPDEDKLPELGLRQHELLYHFAANPDTSIYNIYPPKKNESEYKNAIKRAKQLSKYNLVEVHKIPPNKKANYYKLSSYGIYYLLAEDQSLPEGIIKNLIIHYGDNMLFNLFLYPYITRTSLLGIIDSVLFAQLKSYLQKCSKKLKEMFYNVDHLSNQKNGYITDQLFVWENIPTVEYDTKNLRKFLKLRFGFDWIGRADFKKSEDGNAITILYESNRLLIKLKDKEKAILSKRGKNIYEFIVRQGVNQLIIDTTESIFGKTLVVTSSKMQYLLQFFISQQAYVVDLIFSLFSIYGSRSPAIEILSKDENFKQALRKTKQHFDKRYKFFIRRVVK